MITNLQIGYNGRLGNQIFQYAACFATAKRLGVTCVIPQQNVSTTKQDGCYDFSNNQWIPYSFRMFDCFEITAAKGDPNPNNVFEEPHFNYTETFQTIPDNTSVQGYFQSEKYFVHYKQELIKELTFKEHIQREAQQEVYFGNGRETVAIHIRRGDNVVNPVFPLITQEYIQQALDMFADKEYNFLVVSDDLPYCKSIFPQHDTIKFSNGSSDFVDLCAMSLADHNIISNSSFSWWGAYLNQNQSKRVIAPSYWFKDTSTNIKDLIPNDWIVI